MAQPILAFETFLTGEKTSVIIVFLFSLTFFSKNKLVKMKKKLKQKIKTKLGI